MAKSRTVNNEVINNTEYGIMSSTQPFTASRDAPDVSIFSSFHEYPFDSDSAFLAGLSQIFGHPGSPVTEAETTQKPDLVLSAKCFYYTRKFKTPTPIEPAAYNAWLASSQQNGLHTPDGTDPAIPPHSATIATATSPPVDPTHASSQGETQAVTSTSANTASSEPAPASPQTTNQQPPYPTSFAAIVDLITNNKPIPGIEEIPTTVLELGSSRQDHATRRKKPWEKDESDTNADTATLAVHSEENGRDNASELPVQDEGLLRLLRPDAVPDSGLIAKN